VRKWIMRSETGGIFLLKKGVPSFRGLIITHGDIRIRRGVPGGKKMELIEHVWCGCACGCLLE
jgi:hypothetical protein